MTSGKQFTIDHCKIIALDTHHHANGNLVAAQQGSPLPFGIKRVYYLHDVPTGAERGGHSHKACYEFLVAASGSFSVTIDDGTNSRQVMLNRPDQGLLITPGIWRTLQDFSSGSVCLVLASEPYCEDDYLRQYSDFLASKGNV
ncbi:MAG: sugar 3,4-ketoisomerase [Muribaculaceae bacterium]